MAERLFHGFDLIADTLTDTSLDLQDATFFRRLDDRPLTVQLKVISIPCILLYVISALSMYSCSLRHGQKYLLNGLCLKILVPGHDQNECQMTRLVICAIFGRSFL